MLRTRLLSALIYLPAILVLIRLGGIPWLGAIMLIAMVGWIEMTRLLQRDHFAVDRILGLVFVVVAPVEAYLRSAGLVSFDLLRPLLTGLIVASLIWALYDKSDHPTANWAMMVAGALYLGFLLGHFVTLRQRTDGLMWTVIAVGLTWIGDTCAYLAGTTLGRHKLWPRISPKKTWEGLIGGTVGTLLAAPWLASWLVDLSLWQGLLLGILVAAAAPFGDFAVSLFKRLARTKDSSNLIPGHGGVLDRLDSLLFTFPAVTYFVLLVAGG